MDMWADHTHTRDAARPKGEHANPSACTDHHIHAFLEIFTPLLGRFHIPLAVSHQKAPTASNQPGHAALQMGLSAGWDCCGRRAGGGGGGGACARNSQHICAPSPQSSPPALYCVTLLGDRRWTA